MSNNDKLRGATSAFTLHYAYLNSVAQELGFDRAETISADVCRMMGTARGKRIKELMDLEELTPETAAEVARKSIEEDFGIISYAIEAGPERIVLQCEQCPVYDGALNAGMNHEAIENQCRFAPLGYMDALIRELNPKLNYRLRKFRNSADGKCEEEIVLVD